MQKPKQPQRVNLQENVQIIPEKIHFNDGVQTKTSRNFRIFRDQTPNRSQNSNTPKKIYNTAGTNDTTTSFINSSRVNSPQGCYIYYDKSYGLSRSNNYSLKNHPLSPLNQANNHLSPQKFKLLKTTEMLQYENSILMKELQERDNVILMYKKGFTHNKQPLNEGEVRNLNLKLAQKNTLIEQFHRSLVQFEQTVKNQKQQVSPMCMQRFRILQELVYKHEHYPIIIRQKILEPVSEIHVHQWQIKMQKSYHQLTNIKQRLEWFERQNGILESTIAGLKAQNNGNQFTSSNIEMQKFNNQIIILQQQISNYKHQISNLTINFEEMKNKYWIQISNKKGSEDTESLKTEIKNLQDRILKLSKNEEVLLQEIQKTKQQNIGLSKKQSQYLTRIKDLEAEIKVLKQNISTIEYRMGNQLKQKKEQIKSFNLRIGQLDKQLQSSFLRVQELERQNRLLSTDGKNWKNHIQSTQLHIKQLVAHIQQLKLQNSILKRQIQTSNNSRGQIQNLKANMNQYLLQIKELKFKNETLYNQRDHQSLRWQNILKQKQSEYSIQTQQIQIKIRKQHDSRILTVHKQYDSKILTLQTQYDSRILTVQKQLDNERNSSSSKLSDQIRRVRQQYQSKITSLNFQIQKYRKQMTGYKNQKTSQQWQRQINSIKSSISSKQNQIQQMKNKNKELLIEVDSLSLQLNSQSNKWKSVLSQKNEQYRISLQQTQIKIRKQMQGTLTILQRQLQNSKTQYAQLSKAKAQQIALMRSQYEDEQKIRQSLERQIERYRIEIDKIKSAKQWEMQIQRMKHQYQNQIGMLWEKLQLAEQHIIQVNEELLITKQRQKQVNDEFLYKLDPKYEVILQKLTTLSKKNNEAIQGESQFWEKYRQKRKKDLQQMQVNINQSLSVLLGVEQAIIVKRSQLYRLDLVKLEDLLRQIAKIKQSKKVVEGSIRQNIQTQFYGLLKSVAVAQKQ